MPGEAMSALFPAAPAERLATLRLLVGGFGLVYATARAAHFAGVGRFTPAQFQPVGIVTLLGSPLSLLTVELIVAATIAAGVAYFAGFRFRISGPLFAALLLWVTSYRSSWGMIFHTENLLVLDVLVVGLVPSADAFSLDARRRRAAGEAAPGPDPRYGWPIRLLCGITVITYVIAGVTKLRGSGVEWVSGDVLRNYVAFDNLRKIELGDAHATVGAALVMQAWLWRPLAFLTLVIELCAPIALAGRRAALVWCAAAWLFHVGVVLLMAIFFPFPVLGVAFAPFFQVERLAMLRPWRGSRPSTRPPPPAP
jgi:hypothetical protein